MSFTATEQVNLTQVEFEQNIVIKGRKLSNILTPLAVPETPQEISKNKQIENIYGRVRGFLVDGESLTFGLKEDEIIFEKLPETKEGFEKLINEVEKVVSYSEHSRDLALKMSTLTSKQTENLVNMELYIRLHLTLRKFLLGEQLRLGLGERQTTIQQLNKRIQSSLPSMRQEVPQIGNRKDPNQGIVV
jgi:hypothetical protein